MSMKHTLSSSLLLASLTMISPASAATIFFDGFGDGDRNNNGTADGPVQDATDVGVVWLRASGSSSTNSPNVTIVDDSAGLGSGNALSIVPGVTTARRISTAFAPITLGEVGDYIDIAFDIRLAASVNSDKTLRFGLFNEGTILTANEFDGNSSVGSLNDDFGYFVQLDTGTPDGQTADIRMENAGDGTLGGPTSTFGANTSDAAAAIGTTGKGVAFRITRNAADDLNLTLSIDGNELINRNLSQGSLTPNTDTFGSFQIANNGADFHYLLDNVTLTSNVPEPATLSLVGLGGLMLLRRR